MPPPQATEDFYRTLQGYQLLLTAATRRLWARMSPDFDRSWARIAPQVVTFAAGSQLAAAQAGVAYVPAVLEETGQPDRPLASVRPQAFAGRASDGRSLPGLLSGSVVNAKRAVERGLPPERALSIGGDWLEQVLQSAVSDAARDATAASIAVREGMGWVRMVNPPCCSRCAVLAGRWYRWSDGFDRHPRCDCTHIPSVENRADDFRTDARKLVDRGLVTDLTKAQRARIDDGVNLNRVLNESRDRWRARMAADKRAARYSRYSDRERRAADRRAARRADQWGPGTENPNPPVGATVHDLFARLTSQVEAAKAMRAAGIAT